MKNRSKHLCGKARAVVVISKKRHMFCELIWQTSSWVLANFLYACEVRRFISFKSHFRDYMCQIKWRKMCQVGVGIWHWWCSLCLHNMTVSWIVDLPFPISSYWLFLKINLLHIFLHPGMEHPVLFLSVCLSLTFCCHKKPSNLGHNFWIIRDRYFIFGMYT